MLRTAIVGAIAALLLPATLVAATPTPASAGRDFKPWGYVRAPDQVLRSGCSKYLFRYKIDRAQRNNWAAEFFVVGPDGQGISGPAIIQGGDPPRGKKRFEACRPTVTVGRYKIKMKITYDSGFRETRRGYVKPAYFRLTRPR